MKKRSIWNSLWGEDTLLVHNIPCLRIGLWWFIWSYKPRFHKGCWMPEDDPWAFGSDTPKWFYKVELGFFQIWKWRRECAFWMDSQGARSTSRMSPSTAPHSPSPVEPS